MPPLFIVVGLAPNKNNFANNLTAASESLISKGNVMDDSQDSSKCQLESIAVVPGRITLRS